jgi:hypothetical protein
MIGKLLSGVVETRKTQKKAATYRDLIRKEARIGGSLFGPTKNGHVREFFCLDAYTWVWHEEWRDAHGNFRVLNTRYDVRPDGVLKSQNGSYTKLNNNEAQKLLKAAELYQKTVNSQLYGFAV